MSSQFDWEVKLTGDKAKFKEVQDVINACAVDGGLNNLRDFFTE